MMPDSEFRLYGFILDALKEMGWDVRPPARGGQVFTQNEALRDEGLKMALGQDRPENVIVVGEGEYWVIEAKSDTRDIAKSVQEAQGYAAQINAVPGLSCRIITGVAGIPDTTHYIETYCLVDAEWRPLMLNHRRATGFVSPQQAAAILSAGNGQLVEYHIDEGLFNSKAEQINDTLHQGGINKRNRAGVLACLLLALAQDERMSLSDDPTTLITDINIRANGMLNRYGKGSFFGEISINLPVSRDNHVKHRLALTKSVEMLRGLNIASTINSGRDVLGQFYEQFLKYANDAKELGIVLTPRHITNFAADVVNVSRNDVVFDPACGTGGFLVAALDRVRKSGGDLNLFKQGNLFGVEQDPLVATLAIVNMIFRGDGSSNIAEGDCLIRPITIQPDKVLMNPPFALREPEWRFADRALACMKDNGLLFTVFPTTTMGSSKDGRGEITWRSQMLARHTLIAVIKLPEDLFYPHVAKGTVGVIIQAHRPHNIETDRVVWAVLDDGMPRTKTSRRQQSGGNIESIIRAIGNYTATGTLPDKVPTVLDCCPIGGKAGAAIDLSPENYIDSSDARIDIASVIQSVQEGRRRISQSPRQLQIRQWQEFPVMDFVSAVERGLSGRIKDLPDGALPLISTSERLNGISGTVDASSVRKIYQPDQITISANGSSCRAFWHDYEFAANGDVFVLSLKNEYLRDNFGLFLCATINNESWRYNYYRKFTAAQLAKLEVKVPVDHSGAIDFQAIARLVADAG